MAAPLPSLLIFSWWEECGFVLVFFYSYALEVFIEMCVRAMPLEFIEDKYDMRFPSHT
jgi:hypothetical protein